LETRENALIREWVAEWALFRLNYIQKCNPPPVKPSFTTRRIRKVTKWHRFNTQHIRKEVARNLGLLHVMAFEFAQNTELSLGEREKWARLTAYISQTINTISRSYDDVKIEETLQGLETYVKENIEG